MGITKKIIIAICTLHSANCVKKLIQWHEEESSIALRTVRFTLRPFYPWYLLVRRLIGPQNRFGRRAEEKILPLPGLELRPPSVFHSVSVFCRHGSWNSVMALGLASTRSSFPHCAGDCKMSAAEDGMTWMPNFVKLTARSQAVCRCTVCCGSCKLEVDVIYSCTSLPTLSRNLLFSPEEGTCPLSGIVCNDLHQSVRCYVPKCTLSL
jgi:hypothetical protein